MEKVQLVLERWRDRLRPIWLRLRIASRAPVRRLATLATFLGQNPCVAGPERTPCVQGWITLRRPCLVVRAAAVRSRSPWASASCVTPQPAQIDGDQLLPEGPAPRRSFEPPPHGLSPTVREAAEHPCDRRELPPDRAQVRRVSDAAEIDSRERYSACAAI